MIPVCNVLGSTAGKLARVPRIVCTKLALGNYRDKARLLPKLENATDPIFHLVHCKSHGILEDIARREPIPREKMRVIYNGLRPERFAGPFDRAAIRAALQVPADAFVAGMVANLIPYKGHKDVISAAAQVLPHHPNLHFLFVGRDNGIQAALEQQASAAGIRDRITFAGERRDVPELLSAMDLLISASHEEGFSNVLLEGMASGLPIIATRVGGNPEAVVDGETGFLIDPRSRADLAEKLATMLALPDSGRSLGEQGRRRVTELFSYEAMIRGMQNFYDEALET